MRKPGRINTGNEAKFCATNLLMRNRGIDIKFRRIILMRGGGLMFWNVRGMNYELLGVW